MDQFQQTLKKVLELTGLNEPAVSIDAENRKIDVYLNEGEWLKKWLPTLVADLDHLAKLMGRKEGLDSYYLDINSYRKERERLIVELAKAAARKASAAKEEVRLPAMNAYERRLIHVELAVHPSVKTESEGEGRQRCVIVKPIE